MKGSNMSETTGKKRATKQPSKTPEQRDQERRERFQKLAERRVNNALKAIRNVARMANRANYKYTDDESARIVNTLKDATTDMADAFSKTGSESPAFRLF